MSKLAPAGEEKIAYQGRIIEIVNQDMTDGAKTITFEWARRAPGVRLIIVDEDKQTVLLTKEHRYELGVDDFRLPGGKVFDSLDEYNTFLKTGNDIIKPAQKKAVAEAEEEVGVTVESVSHFHTSVCGATVQWDLLYFVSTEWAPAEQKLELGENIEVVELSFSDALDAALNGQMSEERSALVLLRYLSDKA